MIDTNNATINKILSIFYQKVAHHSGAVENGFLKEKFKQGEWYRADFEVIESRLKNGWTEIDMISKLLACAKVGIKATYISEVIPPRPPIEENENINLLLDSEKYRHPKLRNSTLPVIVDGKLSNKVSITRVNKFTLRDLVDYYMQRLKPDVVRDEIRRALKNLLAKGTHLDDLLTGIDLWAESSDDYNTRDVYTLDRVYCRRAKQLREDLDNKET